MGPAPESRDCRISVPRHPLFNGYLMAATEKRTSFFAKVIFHFVTTVETATYEFPQIPDLLEVNCEMRI
jgi:hypothetical protein